jgi:hypothetical protein
MESTGAEKEKRRASKATAVARGTPAAWLTGGTWATVLRTCSCPALGVVGGEEAMGVGVWGLGSGFGVVGI